MAPDEQGDVAGAPESVPAEVSPTPAESQADATPVTEAATTDPDQAAPDVSSSGPAPIPANAALIPHENADTAGSRGLPGEQLRNRSAQAIADEINGAP